MDDDVGQDTGWQWAVWLWVATCICGALLAGCDELVKYERTVDLSAPCAAGALFTGRTHNGSIDVAGADVTECKVRATIRTRASTPAGAKELAEKVRVRLEVCDEKTISVKIDRPPTRLGGSVSVSLTVEVPNQTRVDVVTHNGSVKVRDLTGDIEAETHNGSITLRDIWGAVRAKTHNGGVKVSYRDTAPPAPDVDVVTHNGNITLISPPTLSARIEAKTHNGSVRTDIPITVTGKIGRKLVGTIGSGEGHLRLRTHNGSIRIKQQSIRRILNLQR